MKLFSYFKRLCLAVLFTALLPLGLFLFAFQALAQPGAPGTPGGPAAPDVSSLVAWVVAQVSAGHYVAIVPVVVYALVWLSRTDLVTGWIPKLKDPRVSVVLSPLLGILTSIILAELSGQALSVSLLLSAIIGAVGGLAATGAHQVKQKFTLDPGNDGKGPALVPVPVPTTDAEAAKLLSKG